MEEQADTVVNKILASVQAGNYAAAVAALAALRPVDKAEAILELDPDERKKLISLLSAEDIAPIVDELETEEAVALLEHMPAEELARVLDLVSSDVAADVLRRLRAPDLLHVLSHMKEATQVIPLLRHADESAGGIMVPRLATVSATMTAENAISLLRKLKPPVETLYDVFVVDEENRLVGVLTLGELVLADPRAPVSEIMRRDVISVLAGTDREEAARIMEHYNLVELPVVDERQHLLGAITVDDVVDVIEEEATEDMFRMVGLPEEERVFSPLRFSIKRRLPWLYVNLATAFLAASVVSFFEPTLAQFAVLAVFMPVVAGQGGNAGIQTLTIIVRGLALGEVELSDAWTILAKEVAVGMVNGIAVGLVTALIAVLWKGNPLLGLIVGGAMVANMIIAALGGVLVPLGLKLFRIDPALASMVFVTTITDVLGFFFFLGLATLYITRLA